jgi:hypothetical protein
MNILSGRELIMRGRLDRGATLILLAAFISFLFSVTLWFFVDKDTGVFVGLWVPSILSLGALLRRSS